MGTAGDRPADYGKVVQKEQSYSKARCGGAATNMCCTDHRVIRSKDVGSNPTLPTSRLVNGKTTLLSEQGFMPWPQRKVFRSFSFLSGFPSVGNGFFIRRQTITDAPYPGLCCRAHSPTA